VRSPQMSRESLSFSTRFYTSGAAIGLGRSETWPAPGRRTMNKHGGVMDTYSMPGEATTACLTGRPIDLGWLWQAVGGYLARRDDCSAATKALANWH